MLSQKPIPWFTFTLTIIFLLSLTLRFWNLNNFNTLVFDEAYYAKFGNNYLTGTEFFNVHPPLSQYIIAIGIWLSNNFLPPSNTVNNLTGSLLSPFSYRWLNALTGSFIPLILGLLAYQLTNRRSYGIITALFAATDGLFLVESRYALNNIYLVIFGLLGQLYFLLTLKTNKWRKVVNLTLSGFFFGASVGSKWNGLAFLLGIFIYYSLTQFYQKKIKQISLLIPLTIITLITYRIIWIPHSIMNSKYNFLEIH